MKGILKALTLSAALISNAGAAIFNVGEYNVTGSTYIQNTGSGAVGIGQVDSLRDSNGNITWQSGDGGQYLNFTFDNYTTSSITPGVITQFTATGGRVQFWLTNDSTLFNPTLDFTAAYSLLSSSQLFVELAGHGVTYGGFTLLTYNAFGWLDVVAGLGSDWFRFDTNSVTTLDGTQADASFNISADTLSGGNVNPAYTYSGSSDLNGRIRAIPEPLPLALLGLGFIALGRKFKGRELA